MKLVIILGAVYSMTSLMWLGGCAAWFSSEREQLRRAVGEKAEAVAQRAIRSARMRMWFSPIWPVAALMLGLYTLRNGDKKP